jgi:hypothetical protein
VIAAAGQDAIWVAVGLLVVSVLGFFVVRFNASKIRQYVFPVAQAGALIGSAGYITWGVSGHHWMIWYGAAAAVSVIVTLLPRRWISWLVREPR